MDTNQSPIVATNLVRHFGSVKAVDGVDLEVRPGEIFGFLGPNGAGKSTVIRMLTTLLTPTSGSATVAGFDIVSQANDVRRNIGVALQDAAIDPLMRAASCCTCKPCCTACRHRCEVTSRELLGRSVWSALRTPGRHLLGRNTPARPALSLIHQPTVLFDSRPPG